MRSLILLAALIVPAGLAAAPSEPAPPARPTSPTKVCANTKMQWADRTGSVQVKNLGDLPPGELTLAVVRDVAGCVEPVIVGYDYGAVAPRDSGKPRNARRR